MKTLILILIFVTAGIGQEKIDTLLTGWIWADTVKTYSYIDIFGVNHEFISPERIADLKMYDSLYLRNHAVLLIHLLADYEQDCWADSSRDTLDWERVESIQCDSTLRADSIKVFSEYGNVSWDYIVHYPRCCYKPILSEWKHKPFPKELKLFLEYLRKRK